jgi:hypothetical protein
MDADHPVCALVRHAPAAGSACELDSRLRHLQVDGVKADGAAVPVEFDLERDLAAERAASLWVDIDMDVYASRPDTWIESVTRGAEGHGGFRFELRRRSRGIR